MRKSMQESNENAKIRKSAQNANSDFKYKRILQLYTRLLKGEVINKAKEAAAANVTERSIQRDLDDLRAFFDEQAANEYSRAAEPPVQCGVSHLSRRTEPHCL